MIWPPPGTVRLATTRDLARLYQVWGRERLLAWMDEKRAMAPAELRPGMDRHYDLVASWRASTFPSEWSVSARPTPLREAERFIERATSAASGRWY